MVANRRRIQFTVVAGAVFTWLAAGNAVAQPASASEEQFRTWTSADGRFQVEAVMIEEQDDAVLLETKQGKQLKVLLDKLSAEDREFVQGLHEPAPAAAEDPKQPPHVIAAEPVVWQCKQQSHAGKLMLDMDGVSVLFMGMSLPPAGVASHPVAVDGPGTYTGSGAAGTGKYQISLRTEYADGVATIKVALRTQQHRLEIRRGGKQLVVNDKFTFDLSQGKKVIEVGSRGTAKERK